MARRLTLFITLLLTLQASAQVLELSDSVRINFRQSKVEVDSSYMDNRASLRHAREVIAFHNGEGSAYPVTRVEVVGAASPEGSVDFNEWLSHERADRIFEILSKGISFPDSITGFKFLGRDWTGARRMAAADPKVPYRDETVALLDEIIADCAGGEKESSGNLARLKRLRKGVPYNYLYRHHFPALRQSYLVVSYEEPVARLSVPAMNPTFDRRMASVDIPDLIISPIVYEQADASEETCRPFYMSLHSNLLLDAAAVPEIGAEFYIGKNWSLKGNWMYGWWRNDARHRYWRMYGGDVAARWWFGKAAHEKPLTGHHVGVYGGVFTFDFEWGGRGYMGGLPGHWLWDRFLTHAGVEYGYSLPIKRRLNLDFNIGIGYLWGEYRKYDPVDKCYVWKSTHHLRWFGPTKAEIALTWLIGCDNYNRKKKKGGVAE